MFGSGDTAHADQGPSGDNILSPDTLSPTLAESLGAKKSSEEANTDNIPKEADEDEPAIEEIQILPNKKTTLLFQFLYNPEYIGKGNNLIINMDNCKAFGKITELIPDKIYEMPE